MIYPEGLMHRKINFAIALLIIVIVSGIFAMVISARAAFGNAVVSKLFWGGEIVATLPCYYIPSGSPNVCPLGWLCPCSFGPSSCQCTCKEQTPVAPLYYKIFMNPEEGGLLPEPAYCHPSRKEVLSTKANIFGPPITTVTLPTGDFPEIFAPGRAILGIGASYLEPLFVATTPSGNTNAPTRLQPNENFAPGFGAF